MRIIDNASILHRQLEGLKEDKALKQVCQDFESIFLSIMFKEMQKTVPEDGLIEKSTASKMFEDMYIEELSNEIANDDNGIGIGRMLYDQFKSGNIVL